MFQQKFSNFRISCLPSYLILFQINTAGIRVVQRRDASQSKWYNKTDTLERLKQLCPPDAQHGCFDNLPQSSLHLHTSSSAYFPIIPRSETTRAQVDDLEKISKQTTKPLKDVDV